MTATAAIGRAGQPETGSCCHFSRMDAGLEPPSAVLPGQKKGVELKVEQPEHGPVLILDANAWWMIDLLCFGAAHSSRAL